MKIKISILLLILITALTAAFFCIPAYGLEMGGLTSSSVTSRDTTYYTVTVQAGDGGSVFPNGVSRMKAGSSRFFTITPNAGFQVSNVKVNGASVGAVSGYRISNISEDITLEVTFKMLESASVSQDESSASSEEQTDADSTESETNPKTGAC